MSQKRADKTRKRSKRKKQTGETRHLRPVESSEPWSDAAEDQDLIRDLRKAVEEPHPLGLLTLVSTLMSVTDVRRVSPMQHHASDEHLTLDELAETFIGTDLAETTAVLGVIAALTDSDVLRSRIHNALAVRHHPVPAWVAGLDEAEVRRVVRLSHVLGDGENYFIDVSIPGGAASTLVAYVDHNLGTVVKDAFAMPLAVDEMMGMFTAELSDGEHSSTDVDPAEARSLLVDAVDHGAMMFPPMESDTWPAARPLLEWVLRWMPTGGKKPERPEWSDKDKQRLVEDFFGSRFSAGLDHPDHRDVLDSLLWFGTDYGPGDPLRWSPVNVEILLGDWLPRKIVADVRYLERAPDVLRGFVRYCHDRQDIPGSLTTEVLDAIDEWEPDYLRTIRTPHPQGAQALAAMIAKYSSGDGDTAGARDETSLEEMMLESLDRAVGGRAALIALTADPLPDEPFEWAGIPDDIQEPVREVLDLCDRCCEEMLDLEHRTACRRFLSRAAAGDPEIFRRKAAARTAAAAVCWIIAKGNDSISSGHADLTAKDLLGHFDTASAQRARVLLRAVGLPERQSGGMYLGTADLLVSSRRQRMIDSRERYLD